MERNLNHSLNPFQTLIFFSYAFFFVFSSSDEHLNYLYEVQSLLNSHIVMTLQLKDQQGL